MNTQAFNLKSYSANYHGIFPFRVEAERNATDVSHTPVVQQRVKLAQDVNQALDHYQSIVSTAVGLDNDGYDLNSQKGICCRPVGLNKKVYEVYAEFTPGSNAQPITKTQIRNAGQALHLLNYSQDANGKLALTMLDPFSSRILMLTKEAGKDLTVSDKPF